MVSCRDETPSVPPKPKDTTQAQGQEVKPSPTAFAPPDQSPLPPMAAGFNSLFQPTYQKGGDITISPLELNWLTESQAFGLSFAVHNQSETAQKLVATLVVEGPKGRKWKSIPLPVLKAGQKVRYKARLAASFLLSPKPVHIEVKLYREHYRYILDKSSNAQELKLQFEPQKTQVYILDKRKNEAPRQQTLAIRPPKKGTRTVAFKLLEAQPEGLESALALAPGPREAGSFVGVAGDGQVSLSWPAQEGVSLYRVSISPMPNFPPSQTERVEVAGTRYLHQQVENGKKFFYRLEGKKNGVYAQIGPVAALTPLAPPPDPPVVTATLDQGKAKLVWEGVKGATQYHLYCDPDPLVGKTKGKKIPSVQSGYELTGLNPGETLYCVLTAANGSAESLESARVKLAVPRPKPAAPVPNTKVGDGIVWLEWPEVKGATGYQVEWSGSSDFVPAKTQSLQLQEPRFRHAGLPNGVEVFYRVKAATPEGFGPDSPVRSAVPKLPQVAETPVSELAAQVSLDDYLKLPSDPDFQVDISDPNRAKAARLAGVKNLESLDLAQKDQAIALAVAQGQGNALAGALSDQLDQEPGNLNLTLSLSKVLHEQGNVTAALNVLNSSLGRISISARAAVNQELKVKVDKGSTSLGPQSDQAFLTEEFAKLGKALLEQRKYEEALSAYQSLATLSEEYPMLHYQLGQVRRGLKQYNQSKEEFIQQNHPKLTLEQRIQDLKALFEVIALAPDMASVKKAKEALSQLAADHPEEAKKARVPEDLAQLDRFFAKMEKERLAGLSDLGVSLDPNLNLGQLQPGQEFYLDLKIANLGQKSSSPFGVSFKIESEEGHLTYDLSAKDRFEPLVPKSEPLVFSKRLTVPTQAPFGRYRLVASVEQEGETLEVGLENNKAASAYGLSLVEPKPDLGITLKTAPADLNLDGKKPVVAQWTVANKGFLASGSFVIEVSLVSKEGKEIPLSRSPELGPVKENGASLDWNMEAALPSALPEGRFQLVAKLVPGKRPGPKDLNPGNDRFASIQEFQYTAPFVDPQLGLAQALEPAWVLPGQPFEVKLALKNRGNRPAGPLWVSYQLVGQDGKTYPLGGSEKILGLDPAKGASLWTETLRPPSSAPQGAYQLVAHLEGPGLSEVSKVAGPVKTEPQVHLLPLYDQTQPAASKERLAQRLAKDPTDLPAHLGAVRMAALSRDESALATEVNRTLSLYAGAAPSLAGKENLKAEQEYLRQDLTLLAQELSQLGRSTAGESLLQRLHLSFPESTSLTLELAQAQARQGRKGQARETLTQGMNKKPDLSLVLALAAMVEPGPEAQALLSPAYRKLIDEAPPEAKARLKVFSKASLDSLQLKKAVPDPWAGFRLDFAQKSGQVVLRPGQTLEIPLRFTQREPLARPIEVYFVLEGEEGQRYDLPEVLKLKGLPERSSEQTVALKVPDFLPLGRYRLRTWVESPGLGIAVGDSTDYGFLKGAVDLKIRQFTHEVAGKGRLKLQLAWENQGAAEAQGNRLSLYREDPKTKALTPLAVSPLEDMAAFSGSVSTELELETPLPESGKLVAWVESQSAQGQDNGPDNRATSPNPLGSQKERLVLLGLETQGTRIEPGSLLSGELRLKGKPEPKETAVLVLTQGDQRYPLGTVNLDPSVPEDPQGERRYPFSLPCPPLVQGRFELVAQLGERKLTSIAPLAYGPARLWIDKVVLGNPGLFAGGELNLGLFVSNQGLSKSKEQTTKVTLEGPGAYPLGEVQLEPVEALALGNLVQARLPLPEGLKNGSYLLHLEGPGLDVKTAANLLVQPILALSPKEVDVILPGAIPTFEWKGPQGHRYRLVFSANPGFDTQERLDLNWTDSASLTPSEAEWRLIWGLSRSGQKPVYWRIEGQNQTKTPMNSGPQRLQLRNRI